MRVEEFAATASLDAQLGAAVAARTTTQPPLAPAETSRTTSALAEISRINEQLRALERYPADSGDLQSSTEEEGTLTRFGAVEREMLMSELRARRDLVLRSISRGGSQRRTESVSGPSPDDRFVRGGISPIRATVERNGFRTADTCSIELAWEDIPFDPRLLRSFGVEIIIGSVRSNDYQEGIGGVRDERGLLTSTIAQSPGGEVVRNATRFVGKVDQVKVKFASDEGAMLTLECRDLTAQFIDQPLIAPSLDLMVPIDVGITQLLAEYPTLAGMPVIYGDIDDVAPGLAPVPGASVSVVRRARRGRVVQQARSGDQKMNLWDYITDCCVQVGLTPIVRDYELRLCRPETLYGTTTVAPTPEEGNVGGVSGRARRMVYGRNIEDLEFTRKLGGVKVPTIEVRAYDALVGRTRWARWPVRAGALAAGIFGINDPPAALRATEVSPSGANPDDRVQTFTIRYATDPRTLAQIARSIYEEIGRQEIEGTFKTADLTSFESLEEADLLRLNSGDPVEVLVAAYDPTDPSQVPTSATELAALETSRRAAYLRDLGWTDDVAMRFAQLQNASGLQSIFRTSTVRIEYDAEDGVEIEVDFINYVTVRDAPIAEEAASAQVQALAQGAEAAAARVATDASQRRRQLGRRMYPSGTNASDSDAIMSLPDGLSSPAPPLPNPTLEDYESTLEDEGRAVRNMSGGE